MFFLSGLLRHFYCTFISSCPLSQLDTDVSDSGSDSRQLELLENVVILNNCSSLFCLHFDLRMLSSTPGIALGDNLQGVGGVLVTESPGFKLLTTRIFAFR